MIILTRRPTLTIYLNHVPGMVSLKSEIKISGSFVIFFLNFCTHRNLQHKFEIKVFLNGKKTCLSLNGDIFEPLVTWSKPSPIVLKAIDYNDSSRHWLIKRAKINFRGITFDSYSQEGLT